MVKIKQSSFLSVLFLVVLLGCQDQTDKRVDKLFSQWNSNESPGAAVAVVKNGKTIFKKGYGLANLEYGIPITPSTIFHIASVSKQFTVFSILLLEKNIAAIQTSFLFQSRKMFFLEIHGFSVRPNLIGMNLEILLE